MKTITKLQTLELDQKLREQVQMIMNQSLMIRKLLQLMKGYMIR